MNDVTDQFRQAIAAAGTTPPDEIIDDGVVHRFSTNGRPRDDSGWYCLHSDGIPAGSFGDWREGFTQTWCSKSDTTMTEAERQANRERVQAMQRQREAEQAQRQQQAAADAAKRLTTAKPCTQHDYLTRKGIKAHGVKIEGDNLLIPMRDTTGAVCSAQIIAPDGNKLFMPGGRVKGCYFSIGRPDGSVIVCEGLATGASIHEATGGAVAVAFNAGNLDAVAVALRSKYPALKIIIAADDDSQTTGNPGLTKARAAAQAVGGWLAVPAWFPHDRADEGTDFNDLHQLAGLGAVKACIDGAELVTSPAGAVLATDNGDEWPELQPLIAHTEAQDYPLDALPPLIRGAVIEVCGFVKAPVDDDGILTPAMLTLAPDAKQAWVEFHNQIEARLGTGGELYDLRDVGSKAADNVVRLAALFHIFAGSIGPIDGDCVESAVQVITWHLLEAKRFLGELAMPPEVANPMRLEAWMLDWCKREGVDKVSTRQIQQFGPGGLRDKAAYTDAVQELAELGRARLEQDGKKKSVQVNPALLAAAS